MELFLLINRSVLDVVLSRNSTCYHAVVTMQLTANFSIGEVIRSLIFLFVWMMGWLVVAS